MKTYRDTREKKIASMLLILFALSMFVNTNVVVNTQSLKNIEILSLDFSNKIESLKHLDTTTENYDAGNDNTSREYIDTVNEWFVFEGNNTDTSNGFDEPITIVKGYNETNSISSYAIFPYNYTVSVDFMIPSDPGYGNFYILLRYKTTENNYEIVIDTEWNNLVFNYVKDDSWTNIKTTWFGSSFTIERDKWYRVEVNITWEYNVEQGKYMNHIMARIIDLATSTSFQDEVWDDNLSPDTYNGLAFLGFDDDKQFKIYMDNLRIYTIMEKVFEEQVETVIPGDLDILSMYISDDNMIYVKLYLYDKITIDTTYVKYWNIQLDLDKDSRNTENRWDPEYFLITLINTDGSAIANLFDSNGNWIKSLHILGGGIGYNYLVVEINKTDLIGLGDSFYVYAITQLGDTIKDGFPKDDIDTDCGDYVIYYISIPKPTSTWTIITDEQGDGNPSSLDILSIGISYNNEYLFFKLSVAGTIAWYGGDDTGIYRIFIDADNDLSTGYSIGEIGADYMIEHVVGYVPKLWKYIGTGTDWKWEFLKREDYLYNPGSSSRVIYLVPRNDFDTVPLSSKVFIIGETVQGTTIVDDTKAIPDPLPESIDIVIIGIVIALMYLFYDNFVNRKNNSFKHF